MNQRRMLVFAASSSVILLIFGSLVGLELMHVNIYARIFS
jgi:hypothetical protein